MASSTQKNLRKASFRAIRSERGVEMDTNILSTKRLFKKLRSLPRILKAPCVRRIATKMSRNIVTIAGAATAVALVIECVRRFRRQRSMHTAVLDYWFAGDLETAYETKWFVQAGSAAQLALDADIRTRFGELLASAERGELDGAWSRTPQAALALIVLLDQLSRHVHRGDAAAVAANDVRALRTTRMLLARGWDGGFDTAQLIFALMPLRHQATVERLREVLERTAPRLEDSKASTELLLRFRRHTQLRLLHLENRGDPHDILERPDREHELDQSEAPEETLSQTVLAFLEANGLLGAACNGQPTARGRGRESQPKANARRRALPQVRECEHTAGRGQGMAATVNTDGKHSAVASAVDTAPAEGESAHHGATSAVASAVDTAPAEGESAHHGAILAEEPALIVSLSGGVDSMVLTHVLLALRKAHGLRYSVHAVHVDYANRVESGAEATFVETWCRERGVEIRVRTVSEMQRATCQRDEYERETRRIRFDAYKACLQATGGRGVFFGHHEGDLHENVLCNVFKGAQLLNVAGIAAASTVGGVLIYRPMLPHPKSIIYEYAHKYGVPYFKDTTPKWSNRGKLRDQLFPLLQDTFGEGIGGHLSALAKDSAQCAELVEAHMLRPFWGSVHVSAAAAWVDVAAYVQMPLFFWREALRHICEQMLGVGLVKERAALLLMERLQRPAHKRKDGWLSLKREIRALLVGTRLVLFAPHLFPGEHHGRVWAARPHAAEGTRLDPPAEGTETTESVFGPWHVRLRLLPAAGTDADATGDAFAAGGSSTSEVVSVLGSEPSVLWRLAEGRIAYMLPRHPEYAIGSSTHAQVGALEGLRGEVWATLLAAFPQVIGVGQQSCSGWVRVELTCRAAKADLEGGDGGPP
jgi:tRNA(Ile)-lysidine synthetase-like protein